MYGYDSNMYAVLWKIIIILRRNVETFPNFVSGLYEARVLYIKECNRISKYRLPLKNGRVHFHSTTFS